MRAQATGPLLNKLRAFLLAPPVRAIVGAADHDARRRPHDRRGSAAAGASSPKGTLGEDTCRLLGSFIVARVWQAALARAALGPEQRAPTPPATSMRCTTT